MHFYQLAGMDWIDVLDAQCGCATANKFDANQFKTQGLNWRSNHLC
nr:uptake hydrogenase large subunit [uncultured bacterium]